MKILHNRITELHNSGSVDDGPYRVMKFSETVSSDEIRALSVMTEKLVAFTHSTQHMRKIRRACEMKGVVAEATLSPHSYNAMMASATLAIMAAQQCGFAVTRPPGHHATKEKAGGFCFFNNVAIATSYLIELGKKVCIVDIDGHHGNGTQSIFSDDGRVMFCSIHQDGVYPHALNPCRSAPRPKRSDGSMLDIGHGESLKKVINIPLGENSGDDLLLRSLEFLRKYIGGFSPDFIAVSAGFDGHHNDRLLSLNYTTRGYHEAGKYFTSLGRPILAVLEGGYHENVKECVEAFTAGVNGDKWVSDESLSISPQETAEQCSDVLNSLSEILDSD